MLSLYRFKVEEGKWAHRGLLFRIERRNEGVGLTATKRERGGAGRGVASRRGRRVEGKGLNESIQVFFWFFLNRKLPV